MTEYPYRKEKAQIETMLNELLKTAFDGKSVYSTGLVADEIVALFPVFGLCKDCRFNIGMGCNNKYMGELAEETDHSLVYPYNEGGVLETSDNFGCVNFEEKP